MALEEDNSENGSSASGLHISPIQNIESPQYQTQQVTLNPIDEIEIGDKLNNKEHNPRPKIIYPSKPKPNKQKTRMEVDRDAIENKRGTIKTLNLSPRITRSRSRQQTSLCSGNNAGVRSEKEISGSCSINVEELNYAYHLGRSIGFDNRDEQSLVGDAESKMGESTGKL